MTDNFWSSYNGHVSKSTSSPECCYDSCHRAVVCVRVVSRWWLPQVHAWFRGIPYLQTLASYTWSYMRPVLLFSPSIRTSRAMSILSVTISTDTYDPDTGVGTVFNGKLRTIQTRNPKTGRGGMTSSASSVSDSDEHRLSTRRIACIHKPCQFQWLFKLKKARMLHPTSIGISQNCLTF